MTECAIGSVWTVDAGVDGHIVVLAGPFAAARGVPEYLVAPLYRHGHPGFVWTDEDVRLDPVDTGLPDVCYAAIWNARPALAEDLALQVGLVASAATSELRDVYWSSLNEERIRSARLGRRVTSDRDPALRFQLEELKRWAPLSGRVLERAERAATQHREPLIGSLRFSWDDDLSAYLLDEDALDAVLRADPSTITDKVVLGDWTESAIIRVQLPNAPPVLSFSGEWRAIAGGAGEVRTQEAAQWQPMEGLRVAA